MQTDVNVTIRDVANRAGVAVSTVSRVINNLDHVSGKTRKKVLDAVAELGYVHNPIAAAMKTGNTRMIVVAVPDLINDFFSSVVQGVEEIFNQQGYYTLVFTTNESPSKEEKLFGGMFGKLVEGAILIPAVDDPRFYEQLQIPLVLVDRTLGRFDTVVINNYKGAYLATKELLENGHRRIAILNGDPNLDFTITTNRYDGYLAAMKEFDAPVRNEYVRFCRWEVRAGYEAFGEVLALDEPPTAVFATNNQICIGCLNYMRDHGIVAGRDISLVSFDDSLMAQINQPAITVVTRPTIEMGRMAATMLLNLFEGRTNPLNRYMFDVSLTRRDSVLQIGGEG